MYTCAAREYTVPYRAWPHRDYPGEHSFVGDGQPCTLTDMLEDVEQHLNRVWTPEEWKSIIDGPEAADLRNDGGSDLAWMGDDMSSRNDTAGLRILQLNVGKGLLAVVDTSRNDDPGADVKLLTSLDLVFEYVGAIGADIAVLEEPGKVDVGVIQRAADIRGWEAIVHLSKHGVEAGLVVLLGPTWKKVKTHADMYHDQRGEARMITVQFTAAKRRPLNRDADTPRTRSVQEPLHRMLLQAVYGYTNPAQRKEQSRDLWAQVLANHHKYKSQCHLGSSLVVGDLNATKCSYLDTNGNTDQASACREKEASILEALEGAGLLDTFRTRFPSTRAWTRLDDTHRQRRLDHVMATAEVTNHVSTRVGIHSLPPIKSDHLPVVIDVPVDCAGMAQHVTPVWDRVVVEKMVMKSGEDLPNPITFNEKFKAEMAQIPAGQIACCHEEMTTAILSAMDGTVATRKRMQYPRQISVLRDMQTSDKVLRTWKKRLRGAAEAITKREQDASIRRKLRKAAWRLVNAPPGMAINPRFLSGEQHLSGWQSARDELATQMSQQATLIEAFIAPKCVAARKAAIAAKSKARRGLFEAPGAKAAGSNEFSKPPQKATAWPGCGSRTGPLQTPPKS